MEKASDASTCINYVGYICLVLERVEILPLEPGPYSIMGLAALMDKLKIELSEAA